jgi:hypothetical protein
MVGAPMVPIGVALNLAFGSSVVLVNKRAAQAEGPVRSTGLAALLCVEAMVFAPITMYLLSRYPDWTVMYLGRADQLPLGFWGWVATYPAAALVGFYVTRHLVRTGKSLAAWGVLAGGVALAFAVLMFGFQQVSSVGTTEAFQKGAGMQPLVETPLFYLLVAALLAMTAAWGATMWRLTLFGRAMSLQIGETTDATKIRDTDTKKTTRKSSTKG